MPKDYNSQRFKFKFSEEYLQIHKNQQENKSTDDEGSNGNQIEDQKNE